MRHTATWSWTCLLATAAIALTGAKGFASCGDYLWRGAEGGTHPSGPVPCHGPQCSSRPQQPVLPMTSSPRFSDRYDHLTALSCPSPQQPRLARARFHLVDVRIQPAVWIDDIFHPPRDSRLDESW